MIVISLCTTCYFVLWVTAGTERHTYSIASELAAPQKYCRLVAWQLLLWYDDAGVKQDVSITYRNPDTRPWLPVVL